MSKRFRVSVEVEAESAALAAMAIAGTLYEEHDVLGLFVTEVTNH